MKNRGVIPKSTFSSLLRQTIDYLESGASKNLISSFQACGIFPFEPYNVLKRLPEAVPLPKVPFAEVLVNTFK